MRSRITALAFLAALMFFIMTVKVMSGAPQAEPKELAQGLFCNPKGVVARNGLVIDPAHPCHCAHMTHSKDCEGAVEENAKCTQFCHKEHCHCPVTCDPVEQSE